MKKKRLRKLQKALKGFGQAKKADKELKKGSRVGRHGHGPKKICSVLMDVGTGKTLAAFENPRKLTRIIKALKEILPDKEFVSVEVLFNPSLKQLDL